MPKLLNPQFPLALGDLYNGTSSLTQFPANATQELSAQTIFAQVYLRGNGGGNLGYIFGHCSSTATDGIRFFFDSTNTRFGFGCDSTGSALGPGRATATSSVATGNFYAVAATWDGSLTAANIHCYLGANGAAMGVSEQSSPSDGTGSIKGPAGQLINIGNRTGSARTFDGDIYVVARWNWQLSLEQLRLVQIFGPTRFPRGLVLCWVNRRDLSPYRLLPSTVTAVLPAATLSPYTPRVMTRTRARRVMALTTSGSPYSLLSSPGSFALTGVDTVLAYSGMTGATTTAATRPRIRTTCGSGRKLELGMTQADRSSVHPSTSNYTILSDGTPQIWLVPRLTNFEEYTNVWTAIVVKLTGISGATPKIRVDLSPTAAFGMVWNDASERGWFSYDGVTWTRFGNAPTYVGTQGTPGSYVEMSHNAAFTQDVVYVSRSERQDTVKVGAWINALAAAYPSLISNLTGGTNYIVDNYTAQTDELGRTVPSKPLYGFKIVDSSLQPAVGVKRYAALVSGVHAGEDAGTTRLQKLCEWICSSDASAQKLRRAFNIIVMPLLNAPGRDGGHARGQFEVYGSTENELNRHFHEFPAKFETVGKPRTVLDNELPVGTALFMDFHTGAVSGDHNNYYYINTYPYSPLDTRWGAALTARMSGIGPCESNAFQAGSPPKMTAGWAWTYKQALLAQTHETNQARYNTDAEHVAASEAIGKAIADLIDASAFGVDIVNRNPLRTANTTTALHGELTVDANVGSFAITGLATTMVYSAAASSYPLLPMFVGATGEFYNGGFAMTVVNGSVYQRSYFAEPKLKFTAKHRLTDAELATLDAFYTANKGSAISFSWRGVARSAVMIAPPKRTWKPGPNAWEVEAELIEQ